MTPLMMRVSLWTFVRFTSIFGLNESPKCGASEITVVFVPRSIHTRLVKVGNKITKVRLKKNPNDGLRPDHYTR
jgi:hypothetical protein